MVRLLIRGLCLTLLLAVMGYATALSAPQDKGGKRKGDLDGVNDMPERARWEWTLFNKKGKAVETGTFMGYRSGEIKVGKQQKPIGTYTVPGKKQVKATFTTGKLEGTAELRLTKPKPVTFEGDLVRKDGSKQKLVVEIIND
jgi:hypothetical protein